MIKYSQSNYLNINMFHLIVATFVLMSSAVIYAEQISLTIELNDNDHWCFMHEFEKSEPYMFTYKVIKGGNKDIDVSLISPNGRIIYKEMRRQEDRLKINSSSGVYKFCFSNEFSSLTHKIVFFSIQAEEIDNLAVEMGQKKPSAPTSAESSCNIVHESMTKVVNHQKSYRLREAVGRHTAEILNTHVLLWSLGLTSIICIASIGQVLILKTFFTEKLTSLKPGDNPQFGFPRH
ncbi:transmembrane emp24 domain-containing protein 7-like [Octopus sinensis]|uniref:Transmembrane emp24 domain-containing protein 7-like n=1 Tax=Octopus sinensis TaxID=2607531 RepID=A0A7E6F7E5_9MOLL|nr:transmembrane emp24 domain-containing protein 7-like [Octopus sinensis]